MGFSGYGWVRGGRWKTGVWKDRGFVTGQWDIVFVFGRRRRTVWKKGAEGRGVGVRKTGRGRGWCPSSSDVGRDDGREIRKGWVVGRGRRDGKDER